MSLSEKDLALIDGVRASGWSVTFHEHGFVSMSNRALAALLPPVQAVKGDGHD